jgi:heme/copper-type cytochrome/quinol oxidase subunit 1
MSGIRHFQQRVLRQITRPEVVKAIGILLIAVIVVCVVIIVVTLMRNAPVSGRSDDPWRRSSVTQTRPVPFRPTPYYKNCKEAHADGRWDIPMGDPAYRPGLDGDGNGIACESVKSRRGGR